MTLTWYALLGFLFIGYFVLSGFDYGTGVLIRVLARDESERRQVLGAVGPFFLGNEVWLVAAIGVLFGAFPFAEGKIFSGAYPVVVLIALGAVAVTAAVQLRGRAQRGRRIWDAVLTTASVVTAASWGVLLAAMLTGLPVDASGRIVGPVWSIFGPFTLLGGLCTLAVVVVHGATFLTLRLPRELSRRAAGWVRGVAVPAACLVVVTAGAAALSPAVHRAVTHPALALTGSALLATCLFGVAALHSRGRGGAALVVSSVAMGLPLVIVGIAVYPNIMVSAVQSSASLTVWEASAASETLGILGWFAFPVIPVLLAFQGMCWWAFRGRLDRDQPLYF